MNNQTHAKVKVLGKTRRVRKGSLLHLYSKFRGFAGVACLLLVLSGFAFLAADSYTCGALSAGILYNADVVEVTVEKGDTISSLTAELNPELSQSAIQTLVNNAIKIDATHSPMPKDLNQLKVGEKVYVFCNKELAKELNLK